MGNDNCLDGYVKDSIGLNMNVGVTGERKTSRSDSSMPPLPEPIAVPVSSERVNVPPGHSGKDAYQNYDFREDFGVTSQPKVLQEGCYYIRLMPTSLHTPSRFQYEGTLRIQQAGSTIIASGDLYKKDFCESPTYCPSLSGNGDNKTGIPVFPRRLYGYYLRVTRMQEGSDVGKGILLEMEPYQFDHSNHTWRSGGLLTAGLKFSVGPDGIHYWRGDIQTQSNIVMGHMQVVRVSPFLRQAVVEIDRVAASECPDKSEKGDDWQSIFKKAGWHVTVDISNDDVEEPEDFSWSNAELHEKMLKYRESIDLDKQWRYHLLGVRELDDRAFGVMYDNTVKGINDIPREGAAIASHVVFPDEECWGKCKGERFGTAKDPYFRTAIHEIGHAMMLYHPDNPYENYIMQKTVQIAHNARVPQEFPDNIEWSFSPRNVHLLCHLPDIAIRPGGVCFGTPHDHLPVNARDEVIEADSLELIVSPLHEIVPIGAPVRVNFSLTNRSNQVKLVPGSLRMKSGNVSGRVIDPLGTGQGFATIIRYTRRNSSDVMARELPPGESISHSATLLWGTEGPLFPTSGFYRIILDLNWYLEGVRIHISGSAGVMVTPPKDDVHASAALRIFSNPDVLLALAIGGDHIEVGNEVIRNAINHPVLKPHYDLMEAKRVGQRFFKRKPSLKETVGMVDENTVMSPTEVIRMVKILRDFARETEKEVVEKMSKLLLNNAKGTTAEDEVIKILKEVQEQ
jgi:hypothetical protein